MSFSSTNPQAHGMRGQPTQADIDRQNGRIQSLEEELQAVSLDHQSILRDNRALLEDNQRLRNDNQRLRNDNQRLRNDDQRLRDEVKHLSEMLMQIREFIGEDDLPARKRRVLQLDQPAVSTGQGYGDSTRSEDLLRATVGHYIPGPGWLPSTAAGYVPSPSAIASLGGSVDRYVSPVQTERDDYTNPYQGHSAQSSQLARGSGESFAQSSLSDAPPGREESVPRGRPHVSLFADPDPPAGTSGESLRRHSRSLSSTPQGMGISAAAERSEEQMSTSEDFPTTDPNPLAMEYQSPVAAQLAALQPRRRAPHAAPIQKAVFAAERSTKTRPPVYNAPRLPAPPRQPTPNAPQLPEPPRRSTPTPPPPSSRPIEPLQGSKVTFPSLPDTDDFMATFGGLADSEEDEPMPEEPGRTVAPSSQVLGALDLPSQTESTGPPLPLFSRPIVQAEGREDTFPKDPFPANFWDLPDSDDEKSEPDEPSKIGPTGLGGSENVGPDSSTQTRFSPSSGEPQGLHRQALGHLRQTHLESEPSDEPRHVRRWSDESVEEQPQRQLQEQLRAPSDSDGSMVDDDEEEI